MRTRISHRLATPEASPPVRPRTIVSARSARSWAIAVLILVPALSLVGAREVTLQGDPFRGRELLEEKRCVRCHSVWGSGGVLGPEMSTAVAGKRWLDLVGDFWNHTPRMIDAMIGEGYPWPVLDPGEMSDLLAYLYYLRLFDEPGDPTRGAIAYSQLRCSGCHALGGEGERLGGSLDKFSTYPSAVMLGQAMWNAGPKMQEAQIGRWTAISNFSGGEIADIQAYIRARGLRTDRQVELLPLPDPEAGAAVFRAKRCTACHRAGGDGPDISASALDMTVSEISGMLWNHSYAMSDWMRKRAIPFPRFQGTEMADLIGYLYFLAFVGESGDPSRGASVFAEKGCGSCHRGEEATAPDLADSNAATDPMVLSAAMWNHAPEMHRLMAERSVAWPKFEAGDMADLVSYLRAESTAAKRDER